METKECCHSCTWWQLCFPRQQSELPKGGAIKLFLCLFCGVTNCFIAHKNARSPEVNLTQVETIHMQGVTC